MENKLKKILNFIALSAIIFLSGCAINVSHEQIENASTLRLGLWVGKEEIGNKKTIWYDRFYPNGDLIIVFENYIDGILINTNTEFCKWRIKNGIEHTSTIHTYKDGRLRIPRTNTRTYEDSYKILEISRERIRYQDIPSGKIYESKKIINP